MFKDAAICRYDIRKMAADIGRDIARKMARAMAMKSTRQTLPGTAAAAIHYHDIHQHFRRRHLLDGVALTLQSGAAILLGGENGAGKTTLLRILAGLSGPSRGWVSFTPRDGLLYVDSGDSGVDLGLDSMFDSTLDSTVDSTVDSVADSAVDSNLDSAVDSVVDSMGNSALDSAVDSAVDSMGNSALDSAVDSAVDSGLDSMFDSTVDSTAESMGNSALDSMADSTADSMLDSAAGGVVYAPASHAPPADAKRWRHCRRQLQRQVMYLHQQPYLFDGTVTRNLALALPRALAATERARRTGKALQWARLGDLAHAPAKTLSSGEKQRVALARAWLRPSRFLLLDEPIANLDAASQTSAVALLQALKTAGVALLIASHHHAIFDSLIDHRLHLAHGKLKTICF